MSETTTASNEMGRAGTPLPVRNEPRLPVLALGMSLSVFLALTYVICVIFDLWFPEHAMYRVWAPLLPGFTWISWPSFLLGLVETVGYGWYVALILGPLYNLFARKFA
jgi:hypothetical protein